MARRLFLILSALVGAAAGVVVAIESDRVAYNVKVRLERLAEEELGLNVSIGVLRIDLFPPSLSVQDVTVEVPGEDTPLAALHRGSVAVRPWPSASGAIVLEHLELDGLRAQVNSQVLRRLRRNPTRGAGAAEPKGRPSGLKVDVQELLVWSSHVRLVDQQRTVQLSGLDLAMRTNPRRGRQIRLDLASGRLEANGLNVPFEARGDALLRGTLDNPERLELEQLRLFTREGAASLQGQIELEGAKKLHAIVNVHGSLARVVEQHPTLPSLAGDVSAELVLRGTLAEPSVRVSLRARELAVAQKTLGDLDVSAVVGRQRVNVESFRLQHADVGTATGSGAVDLAPPWALQVASRLDHVVLAEILARTGLPDAWVKLVVSAGVEGAGTLAPMRLDLTFDGTVHETVVFDGPARAEASTPVLTVGSTSLSGPLSITSQGVTLRDMVLQRDGSTVNVHGLMAFDLSAGMELHAKSSQLDLRHVSPIARLTLGGAAAVEAVIAGPYNHLGIMGDASLRDAEIMGVKAGTVTADVTLTPEMVLELRDIVAIDGRRELTGHAQFDFAALGIGVDARGAFAGLPLTDVLRELELAEGVRERVQGLFDGSVEVAGKLRTPQLTVAAASAEVAVDERQLGACTFLLRLGDEAQPVHAEAVLRSGQGAASARLDIMPDETYRLEGSLREVPLFVLNPWMGDPELAGEVDAQAQLRGPLTSLTGQVNVQARGLVAYGVSVGDAAITGVVQGGVVDARGAARGNAATLQLKLNLDRSLGFAATLATSGLDLRGLVPLPARASAWLAGSAFAQGMLTSPDSIVADVEIEAARVEWDGLVLETPRPARVHFAKARLDVLELLLASGGMQASVAGWLRTDETLELTVAARGNLQAAAGMVSGIRGGDLSLALRVGGSLDAPTLNGTGRIDGGVYRLGGMEQRVRDISADVSFLGRSIQIQNGKGTIGSGTAQVSGGVFLLEHAPMELDLRAHLDNVVLIPSAEARATARGDLRLSGPMGDLLLEGDVYVDSLQYTANFDLERLIPRRNAPPLRVSALDPEDAIRLGIRVKARNNVLLSNPVLEAELEADLMITGTTERIGLLGTVNPLWAKARYQDKVFTVERASVVFTDEYRIYTQFDVRAVTEACRMQIAMDVSGSSERYLVTPSGQDENGEVDPRDVLACLQFGFRLRELSGRDAAGLSSTLPSSLDALWAVSGMDETVRRYIPVDEFRLTSAWSPRVKRTTPRVVIGKTIGEDLQLHYSRALEELDDQAVSVELELSKNAMIQASWVRGEVETTLGDFGLDLRLRWEFQ